MCGKPDIPDAPVTNIPEPPEPEKTATEVGRSLERIDAGNEDRSRTILGKYDLSLRPNFRLPR